MLYMLGGEVGFYFLYNIIEGPDLCKYEKCPEIIIFSIALQNCPYFGNAATAELSFWNKNGNAGCYVWTIRLEYNDLDQQNYY